MTEPALHAWRAAVQESARCSSAHSAINPHWRRGRTFLTEFIRWYRPGQGRSSLLLACKSLAGPHCTALWGLQLQPEARAARPAARAPCPMQFACTSHAVPKHFVRRGALNLSAGPGGRTHTVLPSPSSLARARSRTPSRRARVIVCHNAQAAPIRLWPGGRRGGRAGVVLLPLIVFTALVVVTAPAAWSTHATDTFFQNKHRAFIQSRRTASLSHHCGV
jgi:hypothetical protein